MKSSLTPHDDADPTEDRLHDKRKPYLASVLLLLLMGGLLYLVGRLLLAAAHWLGIAI